GAVRLLLDPAPDLAVPAAGDDPAGLDPVPGGAPPVRQPARGAEMPGASGQDVGDPRQPHVAAPPLRASGAALAQLAIPDPARDPRAERQPGDRLEPSGAGRP